MRKERFPSKRKSKIMPRSDGPFEILEQIGPNTYKLDLPGDYGVSAIFNVANHRPYVDEDEEIPSLRSNSTQPGENYRDHSSKHLEALHDDPIPAKESKLIKEMQSMVKNSLLHSDSRLGHSSGNCLILSGLWSSI